MVLIEAEGEVEHHRHVKRDLFGDGEDGSGDDDVVAALDGRHSAEPTLRGGGRDDDVGPCHFKTAESDGCDDGDAGFDPHGRGRGADKDFEDELVEEVDEDGDVEATEAGQEAGFFAKVANGCADFSSDGFLLDEEELRLGGGRFLRDFLVSGEERSVGLIGISGLDGEGGSRGGFDHSEGCYDGTIGVADLLIESVREATVT